MLRDNEMRFASLQPMYFCNCSAIGHQSELRIVRKCLEAGCSPLEQVGGATPLHEFFRMLGHEKETKEDPPFLRERMKIFKALAGTPEARARLNEVMSQPNAH